MRSCPNQSCELLDLGHGPCEAQDWDVYCPHCGTKFTGEAMPIPQILLDGILEDYPDGVCGATFHKAYAEISAGMLKYCTQCGKEV